MTNINKLKPPIESGSNQHDEMLAIGLNPRSTVDVKYFKIIYTIWAEEKAKLIAAGADPHDELLNAQISQKVQLRMAALAHRAPIN